MLDAGAVGAGCRAGGGHHQTSTCTRLAAIGGTSRMYRCFFFMHPLTWGQDTQQHSQCMGNKDDPPKLKTRSPSCWKVERGLAQVWSAGGLTTSLQILRGGEAWIQLPTMSRSYFPPKMAKLDLSAGRRQSNGTDLWTYPT